MESLEPYAQYVQFPFLLIRIVDTWVIFGLLEQFSAYLLWVIPSILKALEPLKVSTLKKKMNYICTILKCTKTSSLLSMDNYKQRSDPE